MDHQHAHCRDIRKQNHRQGDGQRLCVSTPELQYNNNIQYIGRVNDQCDFRNGDDDDYLSDSQDMNDQPPSPTRSCIKNNEGWVHVLFPLIPIDEKYFSS